VTVIIVVVPSSINEPGLPAEVPRLMSLGAGQRPPEISASARQTVILKLSQRRPVTASPRSKRTSYAIRAEKTISGQIDSAEGKSVQVSDRYQALECRSLGFRPHMTMRVGGRGHTRRGQTSPFTTVLTMPQRDQANIRSVRVSLPTTINARLNTINDACTRAEFESDIGKCAHAKAGTATAVTPVLPDPLKGTVYFVKNGHPIPDLSVALRGAVAFDLIGRVSIPGGKHLATTFDTAPDVPIRSFTLRLLGGPSTASIGAAANLRSPRSRRAKAEVDYIAQSGKVLQVSQALKVGGCGHRQRRHHRH
jgi:hypothetical protein